MDLQVLNIVCVLDVCIIVLEVEYFMSVRILDRLQELKCLLGYYIMIW